LNGPAAVALIENMDPVIVSCSDSLRNGLQPDLLRTVFWSRINRSHNRIL